MDTTTYALTVLAGSCFNSNGVTNGVGTAATFSVPSLAVDAGGGIWVADWRPSNALRYVTYTGVVTTVVGPAGPGGSGPANTVDGPTATAQFNLPVAVAVNSAAGLVFVCDSDGNHYNNIRVVALGAGMAPDGSATHQIKGRRLHASTTFGLLRMDCFAFD